MSTWFQIVIAALAVLLSSYLSWLSYRKGKAELFYMLFTDYNQKYSMFNHQLRAIVEKEKKFGSKGFKASDFDLEEIDVIMDYLNLCSEEHLWYQKGYIDKNVWSSWQSGMQWWYDNSKLIQLVWHDELDQLSSYYIKNDKSFIQTKKLNQ